MAWRPGTMVVGALVVLLGVASAGLLHEIETSGCRASPDPGQVASPNWLVGFHAVPGGLEPGDSFWGARVEQVDEQLHFASVTARSGWFPCWAEMDPRVRYVEPNRRVSLHAEA